MGRGFTSAASEGGGGDILPRSDGARGEPWEMARFKAQGGAPDRSMTPSAVRTAPPRGETQILLLHGLVAAPQGHERIESNFSLAAVGMPGNVCPSQTIARALFNNVHGHASSHGRVRVAWTHRYAHAAGASAYRSCSSVEIDFQGPAIRTAARGEA